MKKISQSNSVIEIVGLRKGEKLREELHSGSEMISATSFPDIQSIKSAFIYSSLPDLNADVTSDIEALDLIEALIRDNAKS
jgi:FlaA1/EpsC-like NDP-sugar epimerase